VLASTSAGSRGAISGRLSVNLLVGGVAGFGVGARADRRGPRAAARRDVKLGRRTLALVSCRRALELYLLSGPWAGFGCEFYMLSTHHVQATGSTSGAG